jgi:tRNA(adenine34) deaminase
VPVGCVIVRNGKIIARSHNKREFKGDATAHAEILCIQKACKKTGNFRLNGCDMYVTLEPCPMCAGAVINARIDRVFFGAYDEKAGCCGTLYNLAADGRFNHTAGVIGGVLEDQCALLLKKFFSLKRKKL